MEDMITLHQRYVARDTKRFIWYITKTFTFDAEYTYFLLSVAEQK